MDENHIKSAVEAVFKGVDENSSRYLVLKSYCRGVNGVKDYGTNFDGLCGDKDCINCRNFQNIIQEEINRPPLVVIKKY